MSQPVLIHHDQRQCQQVLGEQSTGQPELSKEQSTGQWTSMSSLGTTDPRLGEADTSTHYTCSLL